MVKFALATASALFCICAVDAFAPVAPRVALPVASPSSSNLLHGCRSIVQNKAFLRLEDTRLFSTAAASEPEAAILPIIPVTPVVDEEKPAERGLVAQLKVASYFGLWYLFNIAYNIYNKRVLNMYPLPWIVALSQLGIGIFYVVPLWMSNLRPAPKLAKGAIKPLSTLAFLHMCTHITAVLALGAGAVSFTHIVKAAEPVFTAGFSALLLGQVFAVPVYLSLLPIIAGVGLASLKELSFSWVAFGNAMGSNTASSLRGIMGKKQMGQPVGENMSAANLYAVLTIISFAFLAPAALLVEGAKIKPAWDAAIAAGATAKGLSSTIGFAGLFYYLYNEVAFLALSSVNAVTHAVGNTIKRVVIIVAACIAFKTPMNPLSVAGSTIAILGTLLYSLVKSKYAKK
ncbi:unnamed protein product [Choristocarpus tenellus]